MQRSIPILIVTMALAALYGAPVRAQANGAGTNDHAKVIAAAPGRIEGSAEAVDIGGSFGGVVETVVVKQGDRIVKGQLLVRVDCSDIAAQLEQRKAEYDAAVALYEKLVHGPRPQEIEIAKADVELAQARLVEAQARFARSQLLVSRDNISHADYDTAQRDGQMAAAQVAAAQFRLRLLEAGTREEDLAEGKARMMAAQNAIAVTQAELAKCDIRSPVDGIVLSKHISAGELVSIYFPKPLVTVAEVHRYRVRAEVDENDVPLVNVGQKTDIVVAASLPRLHGVVASLAPGMGRRKILTSDPADKSDRDVREVLIDIDGKPEGLPIGLRVSVLFY